MKQGSPAIFILCIDVCTIGDKQFDNLFVTLPGSPMQRSPSSIMSCIHVRTVVDKEFNDFLIITINRIMQGSPSPGSLHIHIRTSGQLLFDRFNIPFCNGTTQCMICLRVCCFTDLRCWFGFCNGFSRFYL